MGKPQDKVLADEIFANDSPPAAKCRSCGEFVFVGVRCPNCGKILGRKISDGDIEYYCSRCDRDIHIIVRLRRKIKSTVRNEEIERNQVTAK